MSKKKSTPYKSGDRVAFQVEGMDCEREATVIQCDSMRIRLDDGIEPQSHMLCSISLRKIEPAKPPEELETSPASELAKVLAVNEVPVVRDDSSLTLAEVERVVALSPPANRDAAELRIHLDMSAGRMLAADVARCLAHIAENDPEFQGNGGHAKWREWCLEKFGIAIRMAERHLAAGRLLNGLVHPVALILSQWDLSKLELLCRIPSDQVPALVEHGNLDGLTRVELQDKLRRLKLGEPEPEPKPAAKHDGRRRGVDPLGSIEFLAGICADEQKQSDLSKAIDPVSCYQASFTTMRMAASRWTSGVPADEKIVKSLEQFYADVGELLGVLRKKG